jgi:RNA polymerase nonessential primary-like sigma factor
MRGAIALLAAIALAMIAAPGPAQASASGHSRRLAARARRGDRAARAALVDEHMGLVRSIALRYRDLGLPTDDLVQEGAIGLLTAIDEYDPERGTSFSTYAYWRIRAAITHALTARSSLVRVPRPVRERRRQVAAAHDRVSAEGGAPTVQRLASATGLPAEAVAEALAPIAVGSLDRPLHESAPDSALLAHDPMADPETAVLARERTRTIVKALRRLRPHKRAILSRHFGIQAEPETLTEIAADLQLSPERTRALKDEALRELAAELETV